MGLLGPNGAGKTTAVRVLATLLRPDGGTVRVGGYDVVRQADRVRGIVGLTGQYAALDEDLTGTENLVMIGRLLEFPRPEARARAKELLGRFDLAGAARRVVKTYSGGMRRRLDLAATLMGRPQIIFLDEPTTGLDPRARGDVWQIVRGLVADGVTVLLTTQYLDEADRLASEIAVIDHGQVIAIGTPAQLKAKVGDRTLEVRPADLADTARVAAILEAVTGSAPDETDDPGLVTVATESPDLLPVVMERLRVEAIAVNEIGLRLASLDEVFLALTGRRATELEAAA